MKIFKTISFNSVVFVFLFGLVIEISTPSYVLACGFFNPGRSLFTPWMNVRSGVTDRGTILGSWSNLTAVEYREGNCPTDTLVSSRVDPAREPSVLTVNDGNVNYAIYPTNIENVGYYMRVVDRGGTGITFGQDFLRAARDDNSVRVQVRYVATGPLNPGVYTIAARHILRTQWQVTSNGAEVFSRVRAATTVATRVTVTGATCSVRAADRNQQVVLPTVSRTSLQGVDSTAGSQRFTIGVNCPAGVALHATMTDANFPDNRGDFLRLAEDSTAAGVGLQITATDTADVVSYGADSRVAGNNNQWFVGGNATSPATNYIIPFTVRYVRTGETLLPGTVRARSTITFSYQ